MAAKVIIWEEANIFAGDEGTDNSKHLKIRNITLPSFKEKTEEHAAGGAIGALMIGGLGLEPLELGFKLVGIDAQTKGLLGQTQSGNVPYTIYGVARDKHLGTAIERKIVAFGRLTEITESEWERGKLTDQDHKIMEIVHYEEYLDKDEVYYYDWTASIFRVGRVNRRADANAILRIS